MTLALAAECDVRSCLNTLQFVAARAGRVRANDLHTASVGAKDLNKGAFDVWSRLFMHTPVRWLMVWGLVLLGQGCLGAVLGLFWWWLLAVDVTCLEIVGVPCIL